MSPSSSRLQFRPPVTIYVVFHPRSEECRDLAGHLHDWFRLKFDEGDGTEAGLPVWFRARLRNGGIHPPVPWPEAELNVLVVLADDHLVADAAWRTALETLSTEAEASASVVLPVPVDVSSFRLGFLFAQRNRLHAGESRPDDESEAPTEPTAREARAQRISNRARILRRGITEAITRELRRPPIALQQGLVPALASSHPVPLDVFLSHAKRDGREIARNLRDGLADFGQMKTWFDENDLPAGYAWASPMVNAAEKQTAALISIVTDAYPTRPWCRKEVNVARQPREINLGLPSAEESGGSITAWTVQPAVAVTRGRTSWSRPMAQLAQVPHLGWPEKPEEVNRCIADVVDRLLLEALLVTFYRRLAPVLAREYLGRSHNIALLTWVPDPWSIAHVRGALLERDPSRAWILAYPGHGLRSAERQELEVLLRSMEKGHGQPQFVLTTQERLHELDMAEPQRRLQVVLSGGGRPDDVEPAGMGVEHLNDLMVRLTRRLLERGHRIAYGGSLSDYRANLTKAIIATAQGWDRVASDDPSPGTTAPPLAKDLETPPLVNYAAWPFYAYITPRQRAELTGICHFIDVDPVDEPPPIAAKDAKDTESEHARMTADALTRMRRLATNNSQVRIVMGGSIRGWRGWIPGIVEEVLCSYEQGQPCLIIGGFGGCAGELAAFLLDADRPWPEALTLADAEAKDAPFQTLLRTPGARDEAGNRFATAQTSLEQFRRELHGDEAWPTAVPRELFLRLLTSSSPSSTIDLTLRALQAVVASQSPKRSA